MAAVQALSLSVTQIGSQLDHVTTHLTAPTATANAEAAPLAAPVVQPAATQSPREPSVPTPEWYAGDLGACGRFLLQCSLVFQQQPTTTAQINPG